MSAPFPIGFWSRVIKAGETVDLSCQYSLQITNICLTGNIKGTTRSILELSYQDSFTPEDIDGDEEIDSDSDDDDEEQKEGNAALDADKPITANGILAEMKLDAENNEDEDEDQDESIDDSDYDGVNAVIRSTTLASLIPEKIEQVTVNITLNRFETYLFENKGENDISLSGQWFYQADPIDIDDDDSEEEDDEEPELIEDEFGLYDPETGLLGGEITENLYDDDGDPDEDDEDVEDDSARFEELKDSPQKAKAPAPKPANAAKAPKAEAPVADEAEDVSMSAVDTSKEAQNQKKKLKKQAAKEAKAPGQASEKPSVQEEAAPVAPKLAAEPTKEVVDGLAKKPSKRQTLPSGLAYTDSKVGTGPAAKKGQRASMRYIGKLDSGKVFDSNTKGKAFSFVLGAGEVIKGWDEGIVGMSVGGERKLIIPAKLAYGKKGTDGIPPNAQLTFDVKLLAIK